MYVAVECLFCVRLFSPHRGVSNEYTQYTIFNIKSNPKLSKSAAMFFSTGRKNEFEPAVVNKHQSLSH